MFSEPECRKQPIATATSSRSTTCWGHQTIGVRYQFTKRTRLVETAEAIRAMGSNILKISMGRRYASEDYSLPKQDSIQSLVDLASREPSFKAVLDMPFSYYHIWVSSCSPGRKRQAAWEGGSFRRVIWVMAASDATF